MQINKTTPRLNISDGALFCLIQARCLFPHLSIPIDDELGGGKILQPHRAEGVQLGADHFQTSVKKAAHSGTALPYNTKTHLECDCRQSRNIR